MIQGAGQSFKGNDFRDILGPGVYVLFEKRTPVYVGKGSNMLRRLSGLHHKRSIINSCTEIKLFPCISLQAAIELEKQLIARFQPKYNSRQLTTLIARQLGITRTRLRYS